MRRKEIGSKDFDEETSLYLRIWLHAIASKEFFRPPIKMYPYSPRHVNLP